MRLAVGVPTPPMTANTLFSEANLSAFAAARSGSYASSKRNEPQQPAIHPASIILFLKSGQNASSIPQTQIFVRARETGGLSEHNRTISNSRSRRRGQGEHQQDETGSYARRYGLIEQTHFFSPYPRFCCYPARFLQLSSQSPPAGLPVARWSGDGLTCAHEKIHWACRISAISYWATLW